MTASKKSLWGNPKSKCLWFPAIPKVQEGEQQQQPLPQQQQGQVEDMEDGEQQPPPKKLRRSARILTGASAPSEMGEKDEIPLARLVRKIP